MARNAAKEEIQRLIRLAEESRGHLDAKVRHLRHQLDVPARVRSSLGRHPSAWMVGSMASGLVASHWLRRRPAKPKKKRGTSVALLGLILTAVKPAAKIWLTNRAREWVLGRSQPRPSPPGSS